MKNMEKRKFTKVYLYGVKGFLSYFNNVILLKSYCLQNDLKFEHKFSLDFKFKLFDINPGERHIFFEILPIDTNIKSIKESQIEFYNINYNAHDIALAKRENYYLFKLTPRNYYITHFYEITPEISKFCFIYDKVFHYFFYEDYDIKGGNIIFYPYEYQLRRDLLDYINIYELMLIWNIVEYYINKKYNMKLERDFFDFYKEYQFSLSEIKWRILIYFHQKIEKELLIFKKNEISSFIGDLYYSFLEEKNIILNKYFSQKRKHEKIF